MTSSQESQRPLHGLVIGISISESDDLAEWGYTPADVNRATVRMSEALLAAGAQLLFGHDWRPDGIMDAICRLAIRYQPSGQLNCSDPLIQSLLAWPNESSMEPTLRTELEQRGVLKIEMLPAPKGEWQSPQDPAARALALAEMRKKLAERCHARVCLGGKDGRKQGRAVQGFYAGVIEEAYRTLRASEERPVYFGSFLGGVCASVVALLKKETTRGLTMPCPEVCSVVPDKTELLKVMRERIDGIARSASAPGTRAKGAASTPFQTPELAADELEDDLSSVFTNESLQPRSGLEPDEWKGLLDAPDTESFVTWVIRGLRRAAPKLRPKRSESTADQPTTESAATSGEAGTSSPSAPSADEAQTAPGEPKNREKQRPKSASRRRTNRNKRAE